MIVNAPFVKPEPPRPATERPTISIFDELDMPHNKEPTAKTARKDRNVHFGG
jgi:hypothetical protein